MDDGMRVGRRAPRRRAMLLVAVLALAGAAVTGGGRPAAAQVPGHAIDYERSTVSSSSFRNIYLDCPTGLELIGVGASVSTSDAVIESIIPDLVNHDVYVSAHETVTGTTDTWSIQARVVCASPSAFTDTYLVEGTAPSNAGPGAGGVVDCDPGDRTLSVGFDIDGPSGRILLTTLMPTEDSALAVAHEDHLGTTTAWSIRTIAICAGGLSPFIEWYQFDGTRGTSSTQAICPDEEQTVIGGGLSLFADGGLTGYHTAATIRPFVYSTADLFIGQSQEVAPTAAEVTTTSYIVCADLI